VINAINSGRFTSLIARAERVHDRMHTVRNDIRGPSEYPRLGLHQLTVTLALLLVATLAMIVAAFEATGLSYEWRADVPFFVLPASLLIAWTYFLVEPGRNPADWLNAESFLAAAFVLSFMLIGPPGQYAMIALQRPLVDPLLAAVDNLIGVDATRIAAWTRETPLWFRSVLLRAYLSFGVQLFLPVLLIGFWYRRRTYLWEYVWNFYFCSIGVLLILALWPAEGPVLYYGEALHPVFEFSRYGEHFRGVYTGTLRVVPANMDGLVSLPSFHTAAGIIVTWAFRFSRLWLSILVPVNVLLVGATVMSGGHYTADVMAAGALFAASLTLWRRGVCRWIDRGAWR
jgi:hypothetical protein